MGKRRNSLIILALVIALLGGSLLVITSKKTVLGLDLQGGTELVYQARATPQVQHPGPEDIDRAIEIIRQRVDSLGVSEPEISRIGSDEIQVDLPNVSDTKRATDQIGTTAQLALYDFEPNVIPPNPDVTNPEDRPYNRLIDAVEAAAKQPEVSLEQCQKQGCTASGDTFYLFDKNTLEPIGSPSEVKADLYKNLPVGVTRADTKAVAVPRGTIVIEDKPNDDPATDVDESAAPSTFFVLHDKPGLTGDQITDPKPGTDNFNQPTVDFNFTDEGRQNFADVTAAIATRGADNCFSATGQPCGGISSAQAEQFSGSFAIVLDGELVSNPIINFVDNPNGIDGRTGAQISGVTAQEAQDLAEVLKIGALPIKLALISQSTVSATLGQQALDQGLKAGLVGLALVLMFLIFYYRFLGVIAAIGLIVYALFYFAMIKALPITVTLPGIAGLILTIGVAADSNIVIFERIKEEVRAGRSMLSAISEGYRKGIATIIDANVITLLTAFILFGLATAGVKGFAFTLGIGTIVSLFTAVLFTQAVLGILGRSHFLSSPSMLGASGEGRQWKFDFTRASKYFFSLSGCILAIGAIAFATKQLNLGIDFESGTRIQAALAKPATVDEVRNALSNAGIDNAQDAKILEAENPDFGANVIQISAQMSVTEAGRARAALEQDFGLEHGDKSIDSNTIGPTFGRQIANKALIAIIFSLLVISAYVAVRFEGKYAVPVVIALIHDILITAGIYALVGREVTSGTVAAFLTILGYSMYDTVIVFDRVRENVPRMPRAAFSQIVNRSMSEVLTRSLITGLSTVFLIGVLLVFGGDTLKDFAFAMMVGVASGTYSSIFIAAPVLTEWKEREPAYRSRRARIEEAMGRVPTFPEDNVVARIDEVERHVAAPAAAGNGGETQSVVVAPVAVAEPPVERAAPPEPTPEEEGDGVAGRPDAGAERTKPSPQRKKQSRRRRKHGRSR
ncbi:MAG: SecD/SecF fusion protein [Solirubrobacterales bacterium]|jgi:SecD/SecF fusion protein|nr:SecD/SecF fusion protein [Solirubrobacterales bacterium]